MAINITDVLETLKECKEEMLHDKMATNDLVIDDLMIALGYKRKRDKTVKRLYKGPIDWVLDSTKTALKVYAFDDTIEESELQEAIDASLENKYEVLLVTNGEKTCVYRYNIKKEIFSEITTIDLSTVTGGKLDEKSNSILSAVSKSGFNLKLLDDILFANDITTEELNKLFCENIAGFKKWISDVIKGVMPDCSNIDEQCNNFTDNLVSSIKNPDGKMKELEGLHAEDLKKIEQLTADINKRDGEIKELNSQISKLKDKLDVTSGEAHKRAKETIRAIIDSDSSAERSYVAIIKDDVIQLNALHAFVGRILQKLYELKSFEAESYIFNGGIFRLNGSNPKHNDLIINNRAYDIVINPADEDDAMLKLRTVFSHFTDIIFECEKFGHKDLEEDTGIDDSEFDNEEKIDTRVDSSIEEVERNRKNAVAPVKKEDTVKEDKVEKEETLEKPIETVEETDETLDETDELGDIDEDFFDEDEEADDEEEEFELDLEDAFEEDEELEDNEEEQEELEEEPEEEEDELEEEEEPEEELADTEEIEEDDDSETVIDFTNDESETVDEEENIIEKKTVLEDPKDSIVKNELDFDTEEEDTEEDEDDAISDILDSLDFDEDDEEENSDSEEIEEEETKEEGFPTSSNDEDDTAESDENTEDESESTEEESEELTEEDENVNEDNEDDSETVEDTEEEIEDTEEETEDTELEDFDTVEKENEEIEEFDFETEIEEESSILLISNLSDVDKLLWRENEEVDVYTINYMGDSEVTYIVDNGEEENMTYELLVCRCIEAVLAIREYSGDNKIVVRLKQKDLTEVNDNIKRASQGYAQYPKIIGTNFAVVGLTDVKQVAMVVSDICEAIGVNTNDISVYLRAETNSEQIIQNYGIEEASVQLRVTDMYESSVTNGGSPDTRPAILKGDMFNNVIVNRNSVQAHKDITYKTLGVKTKYLSKIISDNSADFVEVVESTLIEAAKNNLNIDCNAIGSVIGEQYKIVSDNEDEVGKNHMSIELGKNVYYVTCVENWQIPSALIRLHTILFRNSSIAIKVALNVEAVNFYGSEYETDCAVDGLAIKSYADYVAGCVK